MLVLHGGGGPQTVAGLAEALSSNAHILVPTHPGFAGEPRPEWFDSIDDLALTYLELLERLALRDVMVIGSSMGGWIASAMAVRDTMRLSSIVLVDAAGIRVEGHTVADVFSLTPGELSALSFHNPAAFRIDPTTLSPDQVAASVGVVGYLLGGGCGWLTCQYGAGAGSMRSVEIVTADGDLLQVNEQTHPDLLWGLRGGGGNFGIVTSLECALFYRRSFRCSCQLHGNHLAFIKQ